jgi:hypothetical protein
LPEAERKGDSPACAVSLKPGGFEQLAHVLYRVRFNLAVTQTRRFGERGWIAREVPSPHRLIERLIKPSVLIIGGYAGSGKTELGRILARATGWPMLDKDTLTRPVVEAALEIAGQPLNDRESETYLNLIRPREYEATMGAAVENCRPRRQLGNRVDLDAR